MDVVPVPVAPAAAAAMVAAACCCFFVGFAAGVPSGPVAVGFFFGFFGFGAGAGVAVIWDVVPVAEGD